MLYLLIKWLLGSNISQDNSRSDDGDGNDRLQNSPYFWVFKYARAVKQKVWNEAENRERDWGETLTPRFTDFVTDFGKTTDCFAVYGNENVKKQ